jgi:carbonic anhydrase
MRLLDAILQANQAAPEGWQDEADLNVPAECLPLAALTCMDARLNRLFPRILGLKDEQFIWLRNAGNVITSPTSSTVRSMAIAIYLKQAKELAVIGHTDCLMSRLTMMELLDRLKAHGIERTALQLPDLQEFFGLFSSEQQNVIRAVAHLRQSPVIPREIPVHGLLVDTATGRLSWVVNGYETLGQPGAGAPSLKELATSHLPASTPGPIAAAVGAIAEKMEPLLAKKWEQLTAKIGEEKRTPPELKPAVKTPHHAPQRPPAGEAKKKH